MGPRGAGYRCAANRQLIHEPEALTRYTIPELVERAGSQGVELLNWLAMRGALTGRVTQIHRNYYVPISNTATGLLVIENALGDMLRVRPAIA